MNDILINFKAVFADKVQVIHRVMRQSGLVES